MSELHEDTSRAQSFGSDAEAYDRARPSYPAELVGDLLADRPQRVLDIGCGTASAARLFTAQGCTVIGVEPDPRMAAVARTHGIDVDVSTFESWDPPVEPFDLIVCGQAWHWIDPVEGPAKAGGVLRPGGRFATFWNLYRHPPDVLDALTETYEHALLDGVRAVIENRGGALVVGHETPLLTAVRI